jgi:hypothetical protein
MIRKEHRAAAWMALVAATACGGGKARETAAALPDSAATAPAVMPAPTTVADASHPNRVIDPDKWTDPQVRAAYAAAKKHAAVLEHIYCYCRCKENHGHRALVECFESEHGSMCDVCMHEAFTAAEMTEKGKTPAEIQQAIDSYYKS